MQISIKRAIPIACLALLVGGAVVAEDPPSDFVAPPPPGKYVRPFQAKQPVGADFSLDQPVVATTYFYWYDYTTKEHFVNPNGSDALTDHPVQPATVSYRYVNWHKRQMEDMIAAGVDVALPVYWGTPIRTDFPFSNGGLTVLCQARDQMLAKGEKPPAIGMFYDTSTLKHNCKGYHVDLTTPAGRRWFYATIRNFFSLVPQKHWAMIDGRPIVMLYGPSFAAGMDGQILPSVRAMFRKDFGVDLYVIKMQGWHGEADSTYDWGGALRPTILDTASIGPGYDHSAVQGRTPLLRPRDDGRFYEFAWNRLLGMRPADRPKIVHIETWNEFHEGTEVCESREYGRQYIELTRKYADQFHENHWTDLSKLEPAREKLAGSPTKYEGIRILDFSHGDGPFELRTVDGRPSWVTIAHKFASNVRYLYFDIEDYSYYDVDFEAEITVTYWDAGPDAFWVEYDSVDPEEEGIDQTFHDTAPHELEQGGGWREAVFRLPRACFKGRSNGGDFRITVSGADLVVSKVALRKAPPEE